MGQYCCCGSCCYFRGWPLRRVALSPAQGFFFSVIDIHVGVDGCGDGDKKEQELSLDEAWQSGEVGHGYWPCTQKEQQEQTQTRIHQQTHETKDSDYSPCVPTSNFPCTAPNQSSSTHWNLSIAPLCPAPPWPGFWVGGIRSPWSATRGQLSFYPVPRGGRLSQEYPFTDANIILSVMWSSSVSQPCHTPTITPPPPHPALTHILNSKAEANTPIFTINSSLQNRPDKRDQKRGHAATKPHPQTSLWPHSQRKSKCKSHHPTPFFCPSVTQFTKSLIIQPLLHPPLTTPLQLLRPLSPLS